MHTTQVLHFAPLRRPQSLPAEVQSDDFAGMSRARSSRCGVDPTMVPEPTTKPVMTWLICCVELSDSMRVKTTRRCMPSHKEVV
mmetsp:Transcript_29982/g.85857  ORF Transcript_29982/g.85857 Transcript_29982/m.85857 type:complete len:84 (+) Transcript_29982:331-582(+)